MNEILKDLTLSLEKTVWRKSATENVKPRPLFLPTLHYWFFYLMFHWQLLIWYNSKELREKSFRVEFWLQPSHSSENNVHSGVQVVTISVRSQPRLWRTRGTSPLGSPYLKLRTSLYKDYFWVSTILRLIGLIKRIGVWRAATSMSLCDHTSDQWVEFCLSHQAILKKGKWWVRFDLILQERYRS